MIDKKALTPADKGKAVRYTSDSGTTVMEGELANQVDGEDTVLVKVTGYLKPKKRPADGSIVEMDPANLEFVDA